jgi:hypothetical protein
MGVAVSAATATPQPTATTSRTICPRSQFATMTGSGRAGHRIDGRPWARPPLTAHVSECEILRCLVRPRDGHGSEHQRDTARTSANCRELRRTSAGGLRILGVRFRALVLSVGCVMLGSLVDNYITN